MKTITVALASSANESSDQIKAGQFAVLDAGGCVLSVHDGEDDAEAATSDLLRDFDREAEVVQVVIDDDAE